MAFPFVAVGAAGANLVGSAISSSDPVKDQERFARVDATYEKALAGDSAALACLESMTKGDAGTVCVVGSAAAVSRAKLRLAEYKARVLAGDVGTALIGQSQIPSTGLAVATEGGKLVLWAALAFVLYSLVLKRR